MANLLEQAKADIKDYGEEVLKERAIPDFRDGLKPVHRRILWAMYEMGLKHTGGTKKCARIVGDVIGKFHPHGDQIAYQALVGLAKPNHPEPLVYGQGNFGNIEDTPAAQRYTEAKLTAFADKYFLDPDYIAVTAMTPNFDDTEKEPVYLPAKLPGPFLFGTEGIAIGCSNYLPAFSKDSVIELVTEVLSGKEATPKLFQSILQFNFPYGGHCVSSKKEIRNYFATGFNKLEFMCRLKAEKKEREYAICTMAPRIKPSKVRASLFGIKAIHSIDLVRSSSDKRWITFSIKKTADEGEVIEKVKKILTVSLNLQTYITVRSETDRTSFKRTTPIEILNDWIDWRLSFEKKVIRRLIGIEESQIRKLDLLIWACDHLELIKRALESKNPDKYLVKHGKISFEDADFILSQQVRRLARLELIALETKRKDHLKVQTTLEKDFNSKKRLVKRVIASLV